MNDRRTQLSMRISNILLSERGATTAEYALVTILIAIISITALTLVGQETSAMFSTISDGVAAANG